MIPCGRPNRVSQQLGHVSRVNGREVFQLVLATGAGSDNDAAGRLGADLLHEGRGDFEREVVFRFQGAERARGSLERIGLGVPVSASY